MAVAVAVAVALGGCANAHVNHATLIASTAMLAVDWGQTREMTGRGWTEQNPLMGEHPPGHVVDMYFMSMAALNAIVYLVMPDRWKSVLPAGVIGMQAVAIDRNMSYGVSLLPLPH